MPEIGEIRKACEIGYKGTDSYIWHACENCGKERWVQIHNGKPSRLRCRSCAGKLEVGEKRNGTIIGELVKGREIGYKSKCGSFIWRACAGCGKTSWVKARNGKPVRQFCYKCGCKRRTPSQKFGEQHPRWKGGREKTSDGYIIVKLQPNDFFYSEMANCRGYVREHRIVMAKKLGRRLQPWEIVHHKGIRYADIRNKSDNLEDNLEITMNGAHIKNHQKGYRDGFQKGLIDGRNKHIQKLKGELRLLKEEQWKQSN